MSKGAAVAIFKDIYTDAAEVDEKITTIQEVISMETQNSVTKTDLVEVLRWLMEEYI